MTNPFHVPTGRPELVKRIARPSRSQAEFKDLSEEALAIACSWFDERTEHVAKMAEITARIEEHAAEASAPARIEENADEASASQALTVQF